MPAQSSRSFKNERTDMVESEMESDNPFEDFRSPRVTHPSRAKNSMKTLESRTLHDRMGQMRSVERVCENLAPDAPASHQAFAGLLQDDTDDPFIMELKAMVQDAIEQ